jgi:Spy/CpxP family protein refolding chaperone
MNKAKSLRGQALCQKLQLSDTQIRQMRNLSQDFHSKADSLADVLKEKRLELLELLHENHASKEQILAYVDHINTLQKKLQYEVIKYLLSQKEILHKDQQQKFIELIEQRLKNETIHFKSTGFDFIEGTCAHNCENSNQCDSLKNN